MGLGDLVKRAVRHSVALTCAWYVLDDWRAGRRLARGRIATRSGARHATLSLDESLAYIERVHADYLTYAGRERFAGIVAEIGPGDTFGEALLLLGDGAEVVHAIDRYASVRDAARQGAILRALAARHGLAHLLDGPTLCGLTYHAGQPAERFFRGGQAFGALRPGGVMVHRIDLRDHGMFAGRHPLTFLTVPDLLYRRMTRASGRPNRVLLPAWRAWLERAGLPGTLRITRLAGVAGEIAPAAWDDVPQALREAALDTVREIRPRLARRFAECDDRDLAVSGCVLVAARPT
jgi:hypothetical protein